MSPMDLSVSQRPLVRQCKGLLPSCNAPSKVAALVSIMSI